MVSYYNFSVNGTVSIGEAAERWKQTPALFRTDQVRTGTVTVLIGAEVWPLAEVVAVA